MITAIIPLALILATGILTSYTDINQKKILNRHIFLLGLLGLGAQAFIFPMEKTIWLGQAVNFSFGVAISIVMYAQRLWRAGDAKLFALYGLLMPATEYKNLLPLTSVVLLINVFLLSFFFILISYGKQIFLDRNALIKEAASPKSFRRFLRSFFWSFSLTWCISPLLHKTPLAQYPFLHVLGLYCAYAIFSQLTGLLTRWPGSAPTLWALGILLRWRLSPDPMHGSLMLQQALHTLGYAFLFLVFKQMTEQIKNADERVPFAPFLFAGCLASYTPLLMWFMLATNRFQTLI